MKQWVLGFMFDDRARTVLLIHKQRPAWQSGLWNGIGGHVEPDDTSPLHAMRREFEEEAGPRHEQWQHFGTIWTNPRKRGGEVVRDCLWLYRAECRNCFVDAKTTTDERIAVFEVDDLPRVVPNLRWLVPMAATWQRFWSIKPYQIFEES